MESGPRTCSGGLEAPWGGVQAGGRDIWVLVSLGWSEGQCLRACSLAQSKGEWPIQGVESQRSLEGLTLSSRSEGD